MSPATDVANPEAELRRIIDFFTPTTSTRSLTPALVSEVVDWIEELRDDDESAHCWEYALHSLVLRAISEGHPDATALANESLRTKTLRFARWCA